MSGDGVDKVRFAELEARAEVLEGEHMLEEARNALDSALALDPSSRTCAEARARIALQLREENAAVHCARALAFHRDHPERQMRMLETAAVEIGSGAIPLFETYVQDHPTHVAAHEQLAELKAQAGAGEQCFAGYLGALRTDPHCKPLLMSYWKNLARSGRHLETLEAMDLQRGLFDRDRDFLMLEVRIANQAGLTDRSGSLLEQLDDRPDAQLARGQHRLQTGRPDEAARLLEQVVTALPDSHMGWALLELAWRIAGDRRQHWLVGQPALYRAMELDLGGEQLADIGALLRTLHSAQSQPLGQSVRGGTQTRGELLMRTEPEMEVLIAALVTAIQRFLAQLPPPDPRHPLLRHTNSEMAFGPSWSVRLSGGGFHAAHFHPGGIISSACYISLPGDLGNESEQAGWLELGRPPPEFGLDLPPLATFEPKPGRLVLFPSFLFHGTRPFAAGERLTVAFDLVRAA